MFKSSSMKGVSARNSDLLTPLQNHLFIEDERQNFDEMRSVASTSPTRGGAISQFLQLFSLILKNGSFCKAVYYVPKSTVE